MISISSAMQQDAIKKLLEGYGEVDFTYSVKEKK